MKSSQIIIRALLGIVFFGLGVFVSRSVETRLIASLPIENSYLLQALIALVFGVFGVFAVPFLAEKARRWFETLIHATVAESLGGWTKQVGKQIGKQVAKSRSSRRKKVETPRRGVSTVVILDTSVIIDGRLLDILRTGFLDAPLIVPQFVLDELQHLADSKNDLKRQRGRRGLEILDEIKKDEGINLRVETRLIASLPEDADVDKQLVQMAKKRGAKIATVDFNLNKAASVSDVKVLNVNELANAVKTIVLPGEKMKLKIVQKGKEEGQGVGYLEDGTMVVVEDGEGLVGKKVDVEVSRVLQTAAGRMVFARKS